MRSRELRVVATEEPVGRVGFGDDGKPFLDEAAADVLAGLRRRAGDDSQFVEDLLRDGWSNGYLYLAPEGAP